MQRSLFLQQVQHLRDDGKSIRAIAAELGVNRGRVERALRARACGTSISADPPAPGRSTDRGFVGRRREMGQLRSALEDVLSGQGRVVMLAGEPGIGKTRTAQELAIYAGLRGARVLWGWCYEEAGAPPYWPWVQPLRSYIQEQNPDGLLSQMGPEAADIAEIIPELRAKLPDLAPPPALEPEQARFRLFDSVAAFLKNAAHSHPLMIVLDDLHWADKPSLLLLQFLARQLDRSRLLLVGCYRDVELSRQHPLAETLAQLVREPVFHRVLFRGLSQEDTGRFIEVTAGIRPAQALTETIHAHTEGNPFFMTEVIRLLREQGELIGAATDAPQRIRIPEGVREVIGHRLNRLSAQCNQMLTVASIIGREFEFKLLTCLNSGVSEERLLEAVEEALAAQIIEEVPGAATSYRFCHALIQETLASELSAARRVRLHAQIGEALEELHAADQEAHASELANHFTRARPVLGPEKLVRYSLLAGEQALASYAYEDALAHFQRGLSARGEILEGREPATDAQVAALLFGLGHARAATADRLQLQQAIDNLHRAFDYYAQAGDVTRAVAVAEYPYFFSAGAPTGMAQLIGRALTQVPPHSYQAGRLLPRYGYVLALEEGNQQGAQEAFSRALAIAQRTQDAELELRTLAESAVVDRYQRRFKQSLEKSLRAIELARGVDDLRSEIAVRYEAALALEVLGNPETARQHAAEMLALAERRRGRYWVSTALYQLTSLSATQGDWETARDFSDHGLDVSAADYRILARRSLLEYETGNFVQGDAYLERLLKVMSLYPPGPTPSYMYPGFLIPAVARITGDTSRLEVGEEAARAVLASPSVTYVLATFARFGLGLAAAQRDDVSAAREQYPMVEPERGTMLVGGLGATDRLLGLLAYTMGNLDMAAKHFEDARAFCRKAGYRPELAWTCCDYAEALLQQAGWKRREGATGLLDEALAIASELGMSPLVERVIALQEKARLLPSRGPAYPDGLTQREVQVLRLVVTGKTDREIAKDLTISTTTVSTHIRNILNKTNTANRTEAATYAARNGLI